MELNLSPGSVRSNRSYPSLNHISLAPLTPRFPIDDEPDAQDDTPGQDGYFDAAFSSQSQPSSYLASRSVPSTPGVLSNSRSASRNRHSRSKSSNRARRSSVGAETDDNLPTQELSARRKSSHQRMAEPSTEWMLRTGIALASSTREEKGQSWLEKRESSTSLVSLDHESPHRTGSRHHHRSSSGWKPRSGMSTPTTLSRRGSGSRSHAASRRSSKGGVVMTGMDMTHSSSRPSRSGLVSPVMSDGRDMPDVIDERIRSEIASIRRDLDDDMSDSDALSVDSDDEIDEQEMQRLTRERGFGLGRWIDRLVEWTLFGVDDLPSSPGQPAPSEDGAQVTFAHDDQTQAASETVLEDNSDKDSNAGPVGGYDTAIARDYDVPGLVKQPGERGGWEDAQWLFRVVKQALL